MSKIINFNEYRGLKMTKQADVKKGLPEKHERFKGCKFMTAEWFEEYMRNRYSLPKLIFHIIEQYGYICCRDGKKYIFEDVRRDVKYYEMCPEIEEKHFKAPFWVKVNGEWYFMEMYTDVAGECGFVDKWTIIGNYDVKGFLVDLYGLNRRKLKKMLEEKDVEGAVREICSHYEEGFHIVRGDSECRSLVTFGGEKDQRECTYKLVEFGLYEYAVLEGTEAETGNKHLVLLVGTWRPKEYAEQFRKKYGSAGIPLLYGKWNPYKENWKSCIGNQTKLYKRLVVAE